MGRGGGFAAGGVERDPGTSNSSVGVRPTGVVWRRNGANDGHRFVEIGFGFTSLDGLCRAASGFGGSFDVTSVEAVGCLQCGRSSPARLFEVALVHRLEGTSDAADELIVVEVTCPECGRRGTNPDPRVRSRSFDD